jgi:hypothetical protein
MEKHAVILHKGARLARPAAGRGRGTELVDGLSVAKKAF